MSIFDKVSPAPSGHKSPGGSLLSWRERHQAFEADKGVWNQLDQETRDQYAAYLTEHHGSPALGDEPVLGPSEWHARQQLESSGQAPWVEYSQNWMISRPVVEPESMAQLAGIEEKK